MLKLGKFTSHRRFTTALTVLGMVATGVAVQAATVTPAHAATTHRVLFDDGHAEEA